MHKTVEARTDPCFTTVHTTECLEEEPANLNEAFMPSAKELIMHSSLGGEQ